MTRQKRALLVLALLFALLGKLFGEGPSLSQTPRLRQSHSLTEDSGTSRDVGEERRSEIRIVSSPETASTDSRVASPLRQASDETVSLDSIVLRMEEVSAPPPDDAPTGSGLPEPVIVKQPVAVKELVGPPVAELPPSKVKSIGLVQFDGVALSDAMRLFSEETGLNIICSADAGKTEVDVYLRDVAPLAALEAIVKANGLFYRTDEGSGIVRIATAEEYEKDLTSFRDEQTKVFTLLYPNPVAVAQLIAQVFGDQVELNTADADLEALDDLSQRFNRFDLVDGRSLGLGTFEGNGTAGGALRNPMLGARGSLAGSPLGGYPPPGGLAGRPLGRPTPISRLPAAVRDKLSAGEIQEIEDQIAREGEISDEERAELMQRGKATIYISTIRRNNQIVVRTGDKQSMAEIEQLVQKLDVPTPTVLLEVKVLRVTLADGINSAFEYFNDTPQHAAGFSDGSLLSDFPGANTAGRLIANGLGVSGGVPGALTFQIVDSNFRFRMQCLESEKRVTALATPLILTANNEVSRIFVGDTLPFTVGFTPSQVVGGFNAVSGAVAATPITELRDVGQSLLITPNINADRTVTLRVVEENSERILGGASIPVPNAEGTGVTSVNVDTVRRRTVSGTIVAKDGMAVAMGGLIEEKMHDSEDRVPVLGNLPGIGFLFRRVSKSRSRSELVVVIRPYVFNTPTESAATSQAILGELSLHPNSPGASGTMNTYLPCKVIRSDPECLQRANAVRFHNVKDSY